MAGFDKVDPGHACLRRRARPRRSGSPLIEICQRQRDRGFFVVRDNALHQRTSVLRKLRVLNP
jgi:hypothetical protein